MEVRECVRVARSKSNACWPHRSSAPAAAAAAAVDAIAQSQVTFLR